MAVVTSSLALLCGRLLGSRLSLSLLLLLSLLLFPFSLLSFWAAAPVGADDLWYHTGQSWVYVSTFLRFSVFPSPPGALQTPHMGLRTPQMVLQTPQMALQTPKMALQTPQMAP